MTDTTLQVTVPLSRLKPGHEFPSGSINSRAYNRDDVEMMAASISTFGVIQPLVAFETEDGNLYVAGGNLRLGALLSLRDRRQIDDNNPVPVVIHKANGDADQIALAISIEENRVRRALHPVEQYEAFATLKARGASEKAIGQMFGMKPKQVAQALALGAALSPTVRKAWFDGEVTEESAKIFTLVSHERQHDYVTSTSKKDRWRLQNHNIVRDALIGNVYKIAAYLKFIGEPDYESAGGKVVQNLFGDEKVVSDYELLESLAAGKLTDIKNKLISDSGWSWAEVENDANRNYRHALPRIGKGAKSTDDDKDQSGCIVALTPDGELDIIYGLVKGAKKKAAPSKIKAEAKPELSAAMSTKLAEQATLAAAEQVSLCPELALAIFVAATEGISPCVAIRSSGFIAKQDDNDPADFVETLKAVLRLKPKDLMKRAAHVIGNALDFRTNRGVVDLLLAEDIGAVIDAIDDAAFQKRLRSKFNAAEYFEGSTAEQIRDAIREAKGDTALKPLEKSSKAKLVEYAVANIPKTGWLPKPMRTGMYKVATR